MCLHSPQIIETMQLTIQSLDTIHNTAREFLAAVGGKATCLAFYAPMGAGKTTFIKALCEVLGVADVITSPTFAIVNEYTDGEGRPVYHFDFYRIKKLEEVYDMGCDDYFDSGGYCLMEWPELVEDALPDDVLRIRITPQTDGSRLIEF